METGKDEADEINPPSLRKVFGDSGVAKILDFLTLYRDFDYSLTEIAKNSRVGWTTLFRIWPPLEKYGIVKMTRKIGRAKLYRLDLGSPIAEALVAASLAVASVDAREITKTELAKAEKVEELTEAATEGRRSISLEEETKKQVLIE